ncbi:MAG TPA: hypothetical protein VFS75_03045 [Candidatus Paceibacterota bacterium]|nr:hypothetical protein [Candidatus Paceibacterota bacterium]
MRFFKARTLRGLTSLEVVVGASIAGIIVAYAADAIGTFVSSAREVADETQALYLAEEGLELARFIRDNDWNALDALSLSDPHYFEISAAAITTTTTPETVEGFSRNFTLENVYRDGSTDDVVASTTGGAVEDSGSKYVTVTVSWGSPAKSVALMTILGNIDQ